LTKDKDRTVRARTAGASAFDQTTREIGKTIVNWKDHAMKNHRSLAFFLGAITLGSFTPMAHAQGARAPAAIQKDYDQFIVKFRVALKANDGAAVTEMTKFPFHSDGMRDAAYFRQNIYGKIFTPKIRSCIARGKGVYDRAPNGEDNFSVFCGDDIYLFTRTPGGFRFAEVGVND
jgi:hypothetical protein